MLKPFSSGISNGRIAMATLFKKILCPIDFDDNSMAALAFAARVAQDRNATLYVLHVVPAPFQPSEVPVQPQVVQWEHDIKARLDAVARRHIDGKADFSLVVKIGDPFQAIMEAERELNPDSVIVATHGRTGLGHFFLGSVAERVVRESTCPVMTLRPPVADA
jgi:nucleotide-binding universal stress UspA family protein